jgi:hypothetical protein
LKEAQMNRLFEEAEAEEERRREMERIARDTISRKLQSVTIPKLRRNISRRNQDRKDAILSIAYKLANERQAEERRQSAARKIQHVTRKYKGKAGKVKRDRKSRVRRNKQYKGSKKDKSGKKDKRCKSKTRVSRHSK